MAQNRYCQSALAALVRNLDEEWKIAIVASIIGFDDT
jgi:hypothetical protein